MPIFFGETQTQHYHRTPKADDTWKCDSMNYATGLPCDATEMSPDGVTPDDWIEKEDGEVFCPKHAEDSY